MRNRIIKEEAIDIIRPHSTDIVRWIWAGFEDYVRTNSINSRIYKIRTRCNIVLDHTVARIKEDVRQVDKLDWTTMKDLFLLSVDNKVFIRINKETNTQKSAANMNKQELAFAYQEGFPGIPPRPPLLQVVYVPDLAWLDLNGIYLQYWINNEIDWVIDLENLAAEQDAEGIVPIAPLPTQPSPSIRKSKPKEGAKKKKRDDEAEGK